MRLLLYKQGPTWMFDDTAHDIKQEPFIEGSSEMIDLILQDFGFPSHGREGVTFEFDLEKTHPDMVQVRKVHDLELDWARYEYNGLEGDLCPVTTVYLGNHPDSFYVRPVGPVA
jgi:hypothetical protein